MISIHRLKLHLPAGMEGRSRGIAKLVAQSLVNVEVTRTNNIKSLTLKDVHIYDGMADQKIANTICSGIARKMGEGQ